MAGPPSSGGIRGFLTGAAELFTGDDGAVAWADLQYVVFTLITGRGWQRAGRPGPGARCRGKLAQPPPLLARDPGAAAERVVDGLGGVADGGIHVLPGVVAHQGEVTALRAEDLGERADVELPSAAVGGGADPKPVAAADGLMRQQVAGDGPGDAGPGGAEAAGRAQHPVEPFGVTQVNAGVGPIQPGDPGQRLGPTAG